MEKKIDTSKIKILICCHKQCDLPDNPDGIFIPVQVGAALTKQRLTYNGKEMQRDDMINGMPCDNISVKNKNYCELTALYWLWKNLDKIAPDAQYLGLNHYRRYFSFDKIKLFDDAVIEKENEAKNYRINVKKISRYLQKYDCITSKQRCYPYSLQIDYGNCHVSDDMRRLLIIIHEKYPGYDRDAVSALICGNRLAHYNMTVIGRSLFNDYCEWLFTILEQCEKEINIEHYSAVQARIFGYMAERLFNVWVLHNCKKVKRMNIMKYSDEKVRPFPVCQILSMVYRLRNKLSFAMNKSMRSAVSYYNLFKEKLYDRKQLQ